MPKPKYNKMSAVELRHELKSRGLHDEGNKIQLMAQLLRYDNAQSVEQARKNAPQPAALSAPQGPTYVPRRTGDRVRQRHAAAEVKEEAQKASPEVMKHRKLHRLQKLRKAKQGTLMEQMPQSKKKDEGDTDAAMVKTVKLRPETMTPYYKNETCLVSGPITFDFAPVATTFTASKAAPARRHPPMDNSFIPSHTGGLEHELPRDLNAFDPREWQNVSFLGLTRISTAPRQTLRPFAPLKLGTVSKVLKGRKKAQDNDGEENIEDKSGRKKESKPKRTRMRVNRGEGSQRKINRRVPAVNVDTENRLTRVLSTNNDKHNVIEGEDHPVGRSSVWTQFHVPSHGPATAEKEKSNEFERAPATGDKTADDTLQELKQATKDTHESGASEDNSSKTDEQKPPSAHAWVAKAGPFAIPTSTSRKRKPKLENTGEDGLTARKVFIYTKSAPRDRLPSEEDVLLLPPTQQPETDQGSSSQQTPPLVLHDWHLVVAVILLASLLRGIEGALVFVMGMLVIIFLKD